MSCKSWNPMAVSVGGTVLTDDPDLDVLAWGFDREPNIDSYNAANSEDQKHIELTGGTNTFNVNVKLIGADPQAQAEALLALESRASTGCPNRSVLFNPFANTLVPAAGDPIYEFSCPVTFQGLTGGTADEPIMSENSWPANTYEKVEALPVTPATLASDAQTATTIDLTWDLDTETYSRQAGLDRVAYFTVYRSGTTGGPVGDPYVLVSPAGGVANTVDPTTPGKVRWQNTGLTASTTYFYVVYAVDQYGMVSAASAELSQATTA